MIAITLILALSSQVAKICYFLHAVSETSKAKWYNFSCGIPSHMENENDFVHCEILSFKRKSPFAIMAISVALLV